MRSHANFYRLKIAFEGAWYWWYVYNPNYLAEMGRMVVQGPISTKS
jgi:hypothetical protein